MRKMGIKLRLGLAFSGIHRKFKNHKTSFKTIFVIVVRFFWNFSNWSFIYLSSLLLKNKYKLKDMFRTRKGSNLSKLIWLLWICGKLVFLCLIKADKKTKRNLVFATNYVFLLLTYLCNPMSQNFDVLNH